MSNYDLYPIGLSNTVFLERELFGKMNVEFPSF